MSILASMKKGMAKAGAAVSKVSSKADDVFSANSSKAGAPSGLVRSAMVRAFNRKKTMNASK